MCELVFGRSLSSEADHMSEMVSVDKILEDCNE
jgi:hypothetical protein